MFPGTPGNGGILPSGREAEGRAAPSARAQEAKGVSSRHSQGTGLDELLGWIESEGVERLGTREKEFPRFLLG